MSCRLKLLLLAALLGAGCGTKPPEPKPLGPETCNNSKDDNGDGKTDCLDPKCFQDAACRPVSERCDNDVDDNGDSLIDCADPMCAGQSCGFNCSCIGGMEVTNGSGGGTGGSAGGGSGGGSSGGGTGGGSGGSAGGGSGGGSGGGAAGGSGGGSGGGAAGGSGGGSGGGSAGGSGGGTGGGSASGGGSGGGAPMTETACADNLDNDSDNATDCDDSDCVGVTCGFGCVCALNRKVEVNCSDGASNDGDTLIDCADTDCFNVGGESCGDGVDNDCDRAIDCADSSCTGNGLCANLIDGKPCLSDGQCAGGRCFTEATSGFPQGSCGNTTACSPGTTVGCNGGTCSNAGTCYARCTGAGISGAGACRAGYVCLDPDSNTGNNNNYCAPACSSASECAGAGTGYGCNAWSKRCGLTDRGLGRYGAACTLGSDCEGGICATGFYYPGGYCVGPCRADTRNCASNGTCQFDPAWGDNYGVCLQSCVTTANCRTSQNYICYGPQSDPTGICRCLGPGAGCLDDNWCCSGSCTFSTCD